MMWISCSIALVQPSSFLFSVKMSWKAKMSSLAAATFLGVQLLRPSKFSFSGSFSCHAVTVIGSHAVSAPRVASILGDNSAGGPCMPPVPLSSDRWGCLTCSSLLLTPCFYSSSAGYMCHALNVKCTWQWPHTHFSVAPTTMHMGTNQKAQQSCGSSTDRE